MVRWSRFEDNRMGSFEYQERRREMDTSEELDRGRRVRLLADDLDTQISHNPDLSVEQRALASAAASHLRGYATQLDSAAAPQLYALAGPGVPVPALPPELQVLLDQAKARLAAMSPEERAEHWEAQRKGWIEGIKREIADRDAGRGTC